MRARGTSGARPPGLPDRDIWLRSQEIEAPADEAERLLDLAAFADNRLDDDDAARIAALLAREPDADADVAAARTLASGTTAAATPDIISRAVALVGDEPSEARVIAFPARRTAPRPWFGAATWSGLAAALVLAGWLGFNLGSGLSSAPASGRLSDEAAANELIDPSPPLLLRDFSESSQI